MRHVSISKTTTTAATELLQELGFTILPARLVITTKNQQLSTKIK